MTKLAKTPLYKRNNESFTKIKDLKLAVCFVY